jgi:hypothetical protein
MFVRIKDFSTSRMQKKIANDERLADDMDEDHN